MKGLASELVPLARTLTGMLVNTCSSEDPGCSWMENYWVYRKEKIEI